VAHHPLRVAVRSPEAEGLLPSIGTGILLNIYFSKHER
jgi:hypothetical protein